MFLVRFSHILYPIKVIVSREIFYEYCYLESIFMFESWLSFNFNMLDMLFQLYLSLMTFVFMKIVVTWIS